MIDNWCGTYKLDENKNAIPCSVEEWSLQLRKMKKNNTKHVAQEMIGDILISTVWLGIDHQWINDAPHPLIFETMVFERNDFHEIYCDRYSTWQEAEEGHQKAVQWVKDGCKEND